MDLVAVHGPFDLGQVEPQEVGGDDLGQEGLGGCHGHLRPGMGVEHGIGFPGNCGPLGIADGQDP